ncbi:hypothetical protein B9G55_12155 [Saccharibacillus sp. O16]|nr:hypothetical protein B9G55_12155 [Saccharibacillus sp. O16]
MRCVQCGAELPEGSRFCSQCGAKQPEVPAASQEEKGVERNIENNSEPRLRPQMPAVTWPEARSLPDTEPASKAERESVYTSERSERREEPTPRDFAPPERSERREEPTPQDFAPPERSERREEPMPQDFAPPERTARREEPAPRESAYASDRSLRREQPSPRDFAPPEPGEPLAVRLTRQNAAEASGSSREEYREPSDSGGELPPQMQPNAAGSGAARFAPPPPPGPPRAGAGERESARREGSGISPRVWIAPPLLAICAAAALIWQVNYERGISAEASEIQRSAADAALGGNYEIAESKLDQALDKRPRDPGIRSDLQTVQTIRRLDEQLNEAQRLLSRSDAAGATSVLDQVNRDLASLNGTAYDRLRDRLNKMRAKLELADIRSDAQKAGTLAELADLLKTASAYPKAQQQPVIELITDRIVEVSSDEAERAIEGGSYYEAAAVIDEARGYAPEAKQLIELEKQIASLTTETTEDEYADSELFLASGQELTSGAGDLQMKGFKQSAAEGMLQFSGQLTNTSTMPMYDLLVEFRSYDANGKFLGENWTEVHPKDLEPGQTASFSDQLKAGAGAVVVVDSVSWYRE